MDANAILRKNKIYGADIHGFEACSRRGIHLIELTDGRVFHISRSGLIKKEKTLSRKERRKQKNAPTDNIVK